MTDALQIKIREGDKVVSHDRSRTLAKMKFSMDLSKGCRDFMWAVQTYEPLTAQEPSPSDPVVRGTNHCCVTVDYVAGDFTIWRLISGDPKTAFLKRSMFKDLQE